MAESTLDTGKKYIKSIFQSDQFYNIPEYQRPYVWGPEQVTTMFDDIATAYEQDRNREYFLGCMIWNAKEDRSGEVVYPYNDILDGQQRFITLYLLQGVIRDVSSNAKLKDTVAKRLQQERDDLEGTPERNRLKFSIRHDDDFLQQYVLAEGGTLQHPQLVALIEAKTTSTSVRSMATALLTMHEWWSSKRRDFDSEEGYQKFLFEFYGYLSNRVLVLYLSTSDNLDDAYNLFTVLNSRGVQLQSSDILRAQNLRVITHEDSRKKYASKWDEYQDTIESPYKSFDEFLWAMVYILMKYRSDSNQSISKAFNFIYERKLLSRGVPTFEFIDKYVQHLEAVFNANYQASEAGCLYENLNYILASTFGNQYIVLLMHYRECFGEANILEFLIKVDNLFSVAWLTDTRSLQTRIFIMLRKMEELRDKYSNQQEASAAFLQDNVLRYDYEDEKANTFIDIEKFFDSLDMEKWGSFAGTRINKTRYLLLKLDLLTGSLHNKLQFNKSFASVEHIMPQKLRVPAWAVDEQEHQEWLHRLGNIVLIDMKKNASLSNSSFPDKRHKYSTYIEGRANTNYVFMTYQHWSIQTLKQNHQRVLNLLKGYYTGNSLQSLKDLKKQASLAGAVASNVAVLSAPVAAN
ncbi:DUF262 domain-containing protein [Hymenobacter pini]|uniref:DUF262 domain-containing protein n=1 Tax=Hymenobacter pini TaxID=2880879 RepID=UPI001CF3C9BC|nr:DUF262 domain-containing protein [Hymenobacter pini]MCA8831901.1 DUF262 domain-containing HNH endonuclease family protein [Hymenobacter pini]